MRFMMLMIPRGYERAAPAAMPSAEQIAEMMAYNESLARAGVLLSLDGLHPPSGAKRVVFSRRGEKPEVIEGPFVGASETVGGYWILRVRSEAEALEWACRCPAWEGDTIELRRIQELEDFPAEDLPPMSPDLVRPSAR